MSDASDSTTSITPLEKYKILRERIEFEYGLINQRVTWLVTSQSFLFSGYAISLNFSGQSNVPTLQAQQNQLLLHAIPVTAILVCIVVYITLLAALHALRSLVARGRELEHGVPGAEWISLVSGPHVFRAGLAAAALLPGVFMTVWLVLLLSR